MTFPNTSVQMFSLSSDCQNHSKCRVLKIPNPGLHLTCCKTITSSGLIPSNQWADDKTKQLSVCRSINKTFDSLHLLCEWCQSGQSPVVNPQSPSSSALMWISRFVWLFHSAVCVLKFPQMEIYSMSGWFGDITAVKVRQKQAWRFQKPPESHS